MRELKFRAWDIDNKQFVYAHIGQDDVWLDDGIGTIEMPLHHSDFEQYTGLKDKNGKEIYEGDIVHTKFVGVDPEVWVIGWDISLCRFGYFYSLERVLQGHWSDHDFKAVDYRKQPVEIIGNIHENPELLEGN